MAKKVPFSISGDLGGVSIGDSSPTRVMGVINLTKNSFFPGSVKIGKEKIMEAALEMEKAGADCIDLGGRSTAPYRINEISEIVETKLIRDATALLRKKIMIPISVDTTRFDPAKAGLSEGASILNDVYGLHQKEGPKLAKLAADRDCSLILTAHEMERKRGSPMNRTIAALKNSLEIAESCSVEPSKVTVDPGIGFFSDPVITNVEWNSEIIANLENLRILFRPICVGVSRKRFIGAILDDIPASERLYGSLAATSLVVYKRAHIVRTHDVKETLDAVRIAAEIRSHTAKNV
ncbi:MAG TPA: dihydropteroate synthase [Nitrososphaerales archaeon]|nr:dihydropteroate synthase [Nitrososphaerales archaeon]